MININIKVPVEHGRSPREDVLDAIDALKENIQGTTPDNYKSRLRGTLRNKDGRYIAHFLVTFGVIALLLAPVGIKAQDGPQIPDEATKRCALLKAYHMNGDSMVRWGSIDLSKDKDPCPKTIRIIPITPDKQPKGKLG